MCFDSSKICTFLMNDVKITPISHIYSLADFIWEFLKKLYINVSLRKQHWLWNLRDQLIFLGIYRHFFFLSNTWTIKSNNNT